MGEPSTRNRHDAMAPPTLPPRLLDRYREEMVVRHYAKRTVQRYVGWLRRYLRFHQLRHLREMTTLNGECGAPCASNEIRAIAVEVDGRDSLVGLCPCDWYTGEANIVFPFD